MQQIVSYSYSINPQHVSSVFTPIVRRSDCVSLPMVSCPVIVVVINHYLLHLVGLTFIYLKKMHGHPNVKFTI
jgi:hypothetical protein